MTAWNARFFLDEFPSLPGSRGSTSQLYQTCLLVERRHRKGSVIFFEEDPGDALFIVESGMVKIYRVAEDGREKTLAILRKGDIFGEMALLDEEPRSAICESLEMTTLYALHRKEFLTFLTANPAMAIHIIKVLCARLRQTNAT